jgi:hypothetical protein
LQEDAERKIDEQLVAVKLRHQREDTPDDLKKLEEGPKDFSDVVRKSFQRLTLFIPTDVADVIEALAWKTGKSKNKIIMDSARQIFMTSEAVRITKEYKEGYQFRDKLMSIRVKQNLSKASDVIKLKYFYNENYVKPFLAFGPSPYDYEITKEDGKDILIVKDKGIDNVVSTYEIQDKTKVYCRESEKRHRLFRIK